MSWRTENSGVELLECLEGVVEGEDLCGADKGEVHRVEEQNNPRQFLSLARHEGSDSRLYATHHCPRKSEREMSWKRPSTTA